MHKENILRFLLSTAVAVSASVHLPAADLEPCSSFTQRAPGSAGPRLVDPRFARQLVRQMLAAPDAEAAARAFLRRHADALPRDEAGARALFADAVARLPANQRARLTRAFRSARAAPSRPAQRREWDLQVTEGIEPGPTGGIRGVDMPRGGALGAGGGSHGTGGAGEQLNSEDGVFYSAPGGRTRPGAGDRLAGTVGWRSSGRLMDIFEQSGVGSGYYRRMLTVHDTGAGRYIGEDFANAKAAGRITWMTCVGTPASLSPHPDQTENEYGTGLPQYARYAPTDAIAWADVVLDFVDEMETAYGVAPDFIELWNEPERVEWFTGTVAELLDFYAASAQRLRDVRPAIKVGGPGLAGYRSPMDGTESVLFALTRHAAATGAPLDFVSWHHYAPANELLFSQTVAGLRELRAELGLANFETAISEWNIYPSAEGAAGPEFDGSHAAANYAGFLTTAATVGLDRNLFFLDQDEDNDPGITDLAGVSLGMLTQHGIKKPVMRLSEIMLDMAREAALQVIHPADEFSLRIAASREGNRVRYVVSNDVVTGLWVFANRSRENGMEPGWLHPLWLAAGGPQATEASLMAQGLTQEQAAAVLGFIPEVLLADRYINEPRPVTLTFTGRASFRLGEVRRFTASVNAPALQRTAILDELEAAEAAAQLAAAEEAAAYLNGEGYAYTAQEILNIEGDFFAWADQEGIAYGQAVACNRILNDALREERLASHESLNALPEMRVTVESAAAAGITLSGRTLTFLMEPDTAMVFDVLL